MDTSNLIIFDRRFGYSLEDVISLFEAWGSRGRLFYLVIAAIDSVGLIVAYRALLERIYSTYFDRSSEINMYWAIALLSYVDYVENAGQTMMTIAYEWGYGNEKWFPVVVSFSSTANMLKWTIVKYGAFLMFALYIYQRISKLYKLAVAPTYDKKQS